MNHQFYIKRCLQLAKNGVGTTRPNPSVGAVIVYKNKIIGEGFTSPYGGNHAEVNAIHSVKNKKVLKDTTLYVTLEPCSHFGKTPPCADLIIKHQIKNVVIGCVDANPLVGGKGIERLKNAGCNVIVGILEDECLAHHKRFFTLQNKKRPYIILKWAETRNGIIAPFRHYEDEVLTEEKNKDEVISKSKNRLPQHKKTLRNDAQPIWISNQYSQQLVHKWRSKEHAILVGTNTVIADNPKLNVRSWSGKNPIRIVLDKSLRIPNEVAVFGGSGKTIVIKDRRIKNKELRQNIVFESIDFFPSGKLEKSLGKQICDVLHKHKIQSVLIEGGTQTLQTFIDEDLWDEARIFIGDKEFGNGVKSPILKGKIKLERNIKNDVLKIVTND
ncbi:MAG: bifunctional diaminohydroxyphosphoribosylaminopyrimidine deaminase/5-amino-6-(5-phosphoribosylamino)uracil reductase RibD [Polaribacter sp.]